MSEARVNKVPLRAGVIGAGRISAEHLKFLSGTKAAQLVGVCDLSPALGNYAAERFRAERSFTSHTEMLEAARPDVVHVLTPPHTHDALARACLGAGCHVICEKPIAPTNAEFLGLWQAAQDVGKTLIEDHNARFTPQVLAVEKIIAEGRIGGVREVEVRIVLDITGPQARYGDRNLPHPSHELPAGVIHEFLPHLTYVALRFLPGFEMVRACWRRHGENGLFKYDDLDALIVSGSVHGRLRFSAHQAPDCFQITIRGSKGWVETELYRPYLRLTTPRKGGKQLGPYVNHLCTGFQFLKAGIGGVKDKIMQHSMYDGLQTFLALTYNALRSGEAPPIGFDDIDRSTRLIDALLAEENRI